MNWHSYHNISTHFVNVYRIRKSKSYSENHVRVSVTKYKFEEKAIVESIKTSNHLFVVIKSVLVLLFIRFI